VNTLFTIGAEVQRADSVEPFDDPGQVLPGRCFRPLAHPCEQCMAFFVIHLDQRCETVLLIVMKIGDQCFLGPSPRSRAGRQCKTFQL
jgi:hypothetical protein